MEYHGEAGENDVNGAKETDGRADNPCDFVVDRKKEFDEADKKKEDCHVQQERDILDDQTNLKFLDANEKERANSDAMCWRLRIVDEFEASTDPLLHKRSKEAAREADAEAEEPKDIHADSIAGQLAGIGLEVLVTFDEERGNRRGEYTRLETISKVKLGAHANYTIERT